MNSQEEQSRLIAPMELIGKAIQQLDDLFKETNYDAYYTSFIILSRELTRLQDHDKYLEELK